jgi:hypothetical protein
MIEMGKTSGMREVGRIYAQILVWSSQEEIRLGKKYIKNYVNRSYVG